jgi:hypothetical protein
VGRPGATSRSFARFAEQLIDHSKLLLEDEATEWKLVEALWRPYIDQGNVGAQFHLADSYLDHVWDEVSQKEMEMTISCG